MAPLTLLGAAAPAVGGSGASNSTVVTVLLALLGSSVLGGVITALLAGLRTGATTRREGYAATTQCLVAWAEYPYRIRRRTSDEPETLAELADRGHDLQEQLARQRVWVAGEHRVLSEVLDHVVEALRVAVRDANQEAWQASPVTTPAQMNLNGFGPGDIDTHVQKLERAVAYRFGARRLLPPRLLRRRLRQHGYLPGSP